ncbi:Hypothetical predicted protein [Olea europaea subsp. europaea]|uniref:Uncharacterized protein n=1 Tax=Olea europaea subsp. europaea TaxID=158383 RepID=A0A8S0VB10_OLEEU|nr:Hypothetical predicted protein [Olea europaea subsp. europaea]
MESNGISLFPLETCPPVTEEQFNIFHSGDRRLYSALIIDLGRDPTESMQVMAFWMWLEKEGNDKKLVDRMFSLPLVLLNELADETVLCLKCVRNDRYPFLDGNEQISLLPDIVSSRISLRYFHENRVGVLRGVTQMMNSVCGRAFADILQRAMQRNVPSQAPKEAKLAAGGGGRSHRRRRMLFGGGSIQEVGESSRAAENRNEGVLENPMMPIFYNPFMDVPFGIQVAPPVPGHDHLLPPIGVPINMAGELPLSPFDIVTPRQILSNELGEMLSRSLTISRENQEQEVPPDDRTIFLTFSKGYPISEDEVRDFFTRRFGDFIEDIFMQEVTAGEQPLFARLVVRSSSIINSIAGGSKAKYTINGKHVWARKYVKKQHQQQQQQPPRAYYTRQP